MLWTARRNFLRIDRSTSDGWNITLVASIPTRGVFQTGGWGWVKTPFVYAAATRDLSYGQSNAQWRVFSPCYNDNRPLVKTANRPAVRAHDLGGILNRQVALGLYLGYAQGGAVVRHIFPAGPDSKFGFIEMDHTF